MAAGGAAAGRAGGISRPPAVAALAAAVLLMVTAATPAQGFISGKTWQDVQRANRDGGPFVGLVVPNAYEMDPVLESPSFNKPRNGVPAVLDVQGRRFRFGTIGGQSVVMVMTGLSMLNAGLTTQLLLSLFDVKGIVHWGIAGNANEDLQIGDVAIPEYWAHLSLWNWQRNGDGPDNELPLEAAGDYTREYGFLNFSDYTVDVVGQGQLAGNTLNSIWYQPEEIFPASGTPEQRQHAFWVPVSDRYYALAAQLETLELPACVNATPTTTTPTCLPRAPRVTRVPRGCTANVYTDNASYRQFIRATSVAPPWRWRAPPSRSWRTSSASPSSPSARSPTWPAAAPRSATRPPRSSPSRRRTPWTSCSSSCRSSAARTAAEAWPRTCNKL